MNLVDKYIFKQLFTNSLLILVLITSVFFVWEKSVQLIELSWLAEAYLRQFFFNLIFNSLPQIIPTLLPIITGLSIFCILRMQTDREMVILQSSGFQILI